MKENNQVMNPMKGIHRVKNLLQTLKSQDNTTMTTIEVLNSTEKSKMQMTIKRRSIQKREILKDPIKKKEFSSQLRKISQSSPKPITKIRTVPLTLWWTNQIRTKTLKNLRKRSSWKWKRKGLREWNSSRRINRPKRMSLLQTTQELNTVRFMGLREKVKRICQLLRKRKTMRLSDRTTISKRVQDWVKSLQRTMLTLKFSAKLPMDRSMKILLLGYREILLRVQLIEETLTLRKPYQAIEGKIKTEKATSFMIILQVETKVPQSTILSLKSNQKQSKTALPGSQIENSW